MDICSDGHAEIWYEERRCPICGEIEELIEDLRTKIADITYERDELATRLEEIEKDQRI